MGHSKLVKMKQQRSLFNTTELYSSIKAHTNHYYVKQPAKAASFDCENGVCSW